MRLENAFVFDLEKGFVQRDVCLTGNTISETDAGEKYSLPGCYLLPSLTDIHIHGCAGADVCDASVEGLSVMAQYLLSRGIGQFCATSMSLPVDQMKKICTATLAYQQRNCGGAQLLGLYLEGPFLSAEKAGAHNPLFLHAPDKTLVQQWQAEAEGLIKIVAVSPELPGALDFIRTFQENTILTLAHSACTYEQATAAFEAGARQVTHLFNAMGAFSHREPGLVGAAADSSCYAELICDGLHLHPAMVRAAFRLFGAKRVLLISDAMRATGLANGVYPLGEQTVYVKNKRATLRDGTLAGAATDLMEGMLNAVSYGISLHDAVTAAAVTPIMALGLYETHGSLCPGKMANITVLGPDLSLRGVLHCGRWVVHV